MIEDCELLRQYAQAGDETAFATLVARKVNLVYSAALRQSGSDAQLAQEVTQGVFLDLARKARSLTHHTSLTGWLYTSTRFAATKAVRAQQRWQNRTREAQAMHEIEHASSAEPAWAQLRPVLDAALADLGDRDREALLLRFFEERPLAEVGSRIGLSENAARMCVDRALEKLRRMLARRGVTSTAAALGLVLTQHAVTAAPAGLATAATQTALAGAASGVLTTSMIGTKLFQLMAMTKIQAGTAGLIGLAAVAALVFERNENEQLRAENTGAREEAAALRRENERLAALATSAQPINSTPSTLPTAVGRGGSKGNFTYAHAAGAHTMELKIDEVEMERLMDIQRKGQLDARYGALFRRLNLSPEKIDQLKKLLLDRQNVTRDVLHAGKEQGLSMPELHANLPAMIEKTNAVVDENIRSLLGEDDYQNYQNYQTTLPQRAVAEQLASRLNSTADPLTSQQLEQLVQILAANATPAPSDPAAVGYRSDRVFLGGPEFATNSAGPMFAMASSGMLSNTPPVSEAAIAQSESVLTPPQLKALQQIQAEQQAAQAMSQRLMSGLPGKVLMESRAVE
jgi:RNA polymerase sigma factor (sigma-70 family)